MFKNRAFILVLISIIIIFSFFADISICVNNCAKSNLENEEERCCMICCPVCYSAIAVTEIYLSLPNDNSFLQNCYNKLFVPSFVKSIFHPPKFLL